MSTDEHASAPPPWWRRHLREVVVVGVLVAVTVAGWLLRDDLELAQVQDLLAHPAGMLAVVGLTAAAVAVGLPGSLVAIACGVLAGFALGYPLALAVVLLAAHATWWLGRTGHRPPATARAAEAERGALGLVRRIARAVGRADWRMVAALRLIPVLPFALTNYTLGRCGVTLGHYALGSVLGVLPGTAVHVALGHAGARSIGGEGVHPLEWGLIVLGLVVLVVLGAVLVRKLPVRGADAEAEAHRSEPSAAPSDHPAQV